MGLDGKPHAGQPTVALDEPKEPKDAQPMARMFYVAYFKKDAKAEDRPVTFFYNGGPGSSTVWLHMGSLGPKHVVTDTDTHLPAAPYKMVDNPDSLLDVSDLVFIDMPGTGFGRLVGKDAEKAFWGVDEDANAFARFIARFITKYSRWNSPKYLFGESYGTTRSAVLANILENDKDIDLNGVILLSQIFNFNIDIDMAECQPWRGSALRAGAAHVCGDSLVSQETSAAAGGAGAVFEGSGRVRDGSLHACACAGHGSEPSGETGDGGEAARLYGTAGGLRAEGQPARERRRIREDSRRTTEDLTTGRLDTRFSGPTIDPLSKGQITIRRARRFRRPTFRCSTTTCAAI